MNELEERLRRIAGLQRAPEAGATSIPLPADAATARASIPPVRTTSFPLDHHHGGFPLGSILSMDTRVVRPLGQDLGVEHIPARELTFLDTETTGLGGGAGCRVFLVGLGRFREDAFVVEQHTLLDPGEERAFLDRIRASLRASRGVATFFGKAFDRPRLEDRFTLHHMKTRLPSRPHVDLHGLSRRLWCESLPDCRLRTIEERILGFEREDDLPGELCPQAYRVFLSGDSRMLEGVLHHNLNDVLSLAVLAHAVCLEAHHPPSIRGRMLVARGLESLGQHRRALDMFRAAYTEAVRLTGCDVLLRHRAAAAFGDALRRRQRWNEAVAHWKAMAAAGEAGAYPYVELAKFFEHQRGELAAALDCTLRAIKRAEGREASALAFRAARLRRKRGEVAAVASDEPDEPDAGSAEDPASMDSPATDSPPTNFRARSELAPGPGSPVSRLPLDGPRSPDCGPRSRQDLDVSGPDP